jgi:hypothetical protein
MQNIRVKAGGLPESLASFGRDAHPRKRGSPPAPGPGGRCRRAGPGRGIGQARDRMTGSKSNSARSKSSWSETSSQRHHIRIATRGVLLSLRPDVCRQGARGIHAPSPRGDVAPLGRARRKTCPFANLPRLVQLAIEYRLLDICQLLVGPRWRHPDVICRRDTPATPVTEAATGPKTSVCWTQDLRPTGTANPGRKWGYAERDS